MEASEILGSITIPAVLLGRNFAGRRSMSDSHQRSPLYNELYQLGSSDWLPNIREDGSLVLGIYSTHLLHLVLISFDMQPFEDVHGARMTAQTELGTI